MELETKNNLLSQTNLSDSESAKLKKVWRNIVYSLVNVVMYSFRYSLVYYLGIVKKSSQIVTSFLISLSLAFYAATKIWLVSKDKLPSFSVKIYLPVFFRALTSLGYISFSTIAYSNMSIDTVTAIIYLFPLVSITLIYFY